MTEGRPEPDRLKGMAQTRGARIGHAQIAGYPTQRVQMQGHGPPANCIKRFAQCARINELSIQFVRVRKMMVIAGANPIAHGVAAAATGFAGSEFDKQSLRGYTCVAMHGGYDAHLITELRPINIDLRDRRARRDQLASFGICIPLRKTCTKADKWLEEINSSTARKSRR